MRLGIWILCSEELQSKPHCLFRHWAPVRIRGAASCSQPRLTFSPAFRRSDKSVDLDLQFQIMKLICASLVASEMSARKPKSTPRSPPYSTCKQEILKKTRLFLFLSLPLNPILMSHTTLLLRPPDLRIRVPTYIPDTLSDLVSRPVIFFLSPLGNHGAPIPDNI
ncbi:hypothetical protein BJY01DRAFT_126339 [Aspergillus pseudoustus]|uniref:Uncharacterized protein n=1 Tax=Aspergillus pseudoustus TaxID=1810923 RepID=A0ABR4IMY2_9EURO